MAHLSPTSPNSADLNSPATTLNSPALPRNLQRGNSNPIFLSSPISNTSNLSLPASNASVRDPLLRTRSQNLLPTSSSPLSRSAASPHPQPSSQRRQQGPPHQSENDRTDALWAEMQTTLAEVELSATGGTHSFFGPEHAAALEELRTAQIALAQAWARNEAADEVVDRLGEGEGKDGEDISPGGSVRAKDEGDDRTIGSIGDIAGGERETEGDILLARKRREANDRYFFRVQKGVVDVVGRLEEVASAMGKVERESREVWSESESSLGD